jgi:hypothetical protein
MTAGELYWWYQQGQLPCGHGKEYRRGYDDGLTFGVKCPKCGLTLGLINPHAIFRPYSWDQVIEEPKGYKPPELPMALRIFKTALTFNRPGGQAGPIRRLLSRVGILRG